MKKLFAGLLLAALAAGASAQAQNAVNVTLDHGAVWQTVKIGDTTQGFLQIHNSGTAPDVLTAWDCSIADKTALLGVDGKALQSLTIPPGQTVIFSQSGPHLLLQRTRDTVDFGSVVPCSFTFQNAGDIGGYLNATTAPGAP
jgi:copper(I)-binding protein